MTVVPFGAPPLHSSSWDLPLVDVASWIGKVPPDRRFIVDGWLARGTAALLVGEDGVGKSLLAQQLATCVATNRPFLGLPVEQAPALYITCEDDADELWRRQRAINRMLGVPQDAAPAMLSSLVGYTGVELGYYDRENAFQLSPVAHGIVAAAKSRGAGLIVLDNLAHLFPGNENVRRDVAVFCAALERMAIDANATVLLLAHPSKAGAEYSGSTGWSAHVRQRWFLERADQSDAALDADSRVLRKSKANYSAAGTEVNFRWNEWAFTADEDRMAGFGEGIRESAQAGAENDAFLRCLDAATKSRRAVSHNQGVNYAPKVFAAMPEGKGFKIDAFKRAFERLLYLRKIELDRPLWQRENYAWKYGIARNSDAPPRAHEPTDLHRPHPPTPTDPHRAGPPTLPTDPHTPPTKTRGNPSTDPHPPTPIYTTYISGAASPAAPDDDDIEWDMPL